MNDKRLAEIQHRCERASKGPWFTVDPPWRASRYDKQTGLHWILPTYVVASNPDPHVGQPVCDSIAIDEWESKQQYDEILAQSDADLDFIAHARTDLPDLLKCVANLQSKLDAVAVRPIECPACGGSGAQADEENDSGPR